MRTTNRSPSRCPTPANATIGDGSGAGTITDDDPVPALSIGDVSLAEGNAGTTTATFTVSLSAASGRPVTFDWATAPGTAAAGTDYVSATGSRTIAAGATSATIAITVNGDVVDEADETFTVTLSNLANATDRRWLGIGHDHRRRSRPGALRRTTSPSPRATPGPRPPRSPCRCPPRAGTPSPFDWATAPGTATAGTDYVSATGSRTIAAGATSATIAVTVNGDVVDENNESFTVTLSNPANATIGDGSGAGTITDDDPVPALSIGDVSVTEGNAGTTTATFTVSLSGPRAGRRSPRTGRRLNGSAVQPADYVKRLGLPHVRCRRHQ